MSVRRAFSSGDDLPRPGKRNNGSGLDSLGGYAHLLSSHTGPRRAGERGRRAEATQPREIGPIC